MRGHFAAGAPIGGFENGPEAAKSCQEGQTRQMDGWTTRLECSRKVWWGEAMIS